LIHCWEKAESSIMILNMAGKRFNFGIVGINTCVVLTSFYKPRAGGLGESSSAYDL